MIRLRSSHRRTLILRAARAGVGLALVAGLVGLPGGPASAASFVVNSTADGSDAIPGDTICATAASPPTCTLRAAIEETNALAGPDMITFAGAVVQIRPGSALPTITDTLTIDGSTPSSVPPFFPAPGVELDGSLISGPADGLAIDGDMTQIRGLAVNRFTGDGIVVRADDVTIAGSFVGTDLLGMTGLGNGGVGIRAVDTAGLVVGGSSFLDETVVSDNARGIVIAGGGDSTLMGVLIGTDASNEADLGNAGDGLAIVGHQTSAALGNQVSGNGGVGILVEDSDDVTLNGNTVGVDLNGGIALPNAAGIELRGGTGISERAVLFSNIVSANLGVGIRIGDDANAPPGGGVPGVVLRNNAIGTDPGGSADLGNGDDGVLIAGGDLTDGAMIGGSLPEANWIAHNGGAGVHVLGGNTNERVLSNSIHTNGGLGIDLELTANNDQQPPVLSGLVDTVNGSEVTGSLSGFAPSHPYRVEFFGNMDCTTDAGEGRAFLRQRTVDTDASGDASFSFPLTLNGWQAVTATATNDDGTSEFSNCVELGGGGGTEADLSITKSAPADVIEGHTFDYLIEVSNGGSDGADEVVLTDPLPDEVVFVGAVADQGSCSNMAGTVSCALGTLPAGSGALITVSVRADVFSGGDPRTISNTATVASNPPDGDPDDNAATATTVERPASADLSLEKTDGLDDSTGGDDLTYTLTVRNDGPGDATGVTVTDPLPDGTTFGSAVPSQGSCDHDADAVTCALGSMADGASATVTLVLGTSLVDEDTDLTNTASVDAAEPDPDGSDDVSSDTTTLTPIGSADVSVVSVEDAPDPVTGGYDVAYTVLVRNLGGDAASDVMLRDTLPTGAAFVRPNPNAYRCVASKGVVSCSLGSIPAGGSVQVRLILDTPWVSTPSSLTNLVEVTSPDDHDASNDRDAETTSLLPRQMTFATGFIPPNAGDVLVTDATSTWPEGWPIATAEDPTVGAALLPSGPGGVFTIAESPCGGSFSCPTSVRHGDGRLTSTPRTIGSVVTFTPPAAASARDPHIGFLLFDRTIAPLSWNPVRVAFRDAETGAFVRELPWCGWRTSAAACVVSIDRIYSWHAKAHLDLVVKVRFLRAGSFAVMR